MIPKLLSSGRSFKGLAKYLCHDPDAETAERVAWTHTLNCAHDDPASAVHEMYTTVLDAELLKQEAGVRAGGRALQKPVKHFSLNWHASDEPEREHMIETVQGFLQHMKWDEHQALLVAHADKEHLHVHVMLNAVHPETGKKLDDSLERRRAQEWALAYEREQGKIHCEQRLVDPADREPSLPRPAWEALRQNADAEQPSVHSGDAGKRDENGSDIKSQEWAVLKGYQRREREAFFAQGKTAYAAVKNDVYREVREEFRPDWREYFDAVQEEWHPTQLAALKQDILERQKAVLEERRDEATTELRARRDVTYRELLDGQQEARAQLREAQSEGVRSYDVLDLANKEATAPVDLTSAFRQAAQEVCEPEETSAAPRWREPYEFDPAPVSGLKSPEDAAAGIGFSLLGGFTAIGERLFDGFLGGGEVVKAPPPAPAPEPEFKKENPFARVAEAARREAEQQEKDARDRAYWDHRDRTRD